MRYVLAFSCPVWYLNLLSNSFTKVNDCGPKTPEDFTAIRENSCVWDRSEYFFYIFFISTLILILIFIFIFIYFLHAQHFIKQINLKVQVQCQLSKPPRMEITYLFIYYIFIFTYYTFTYYILHITFLRIAYLFIYIIIYLYIFYIFIYSFIYLFITLQNDEAKYDKTIARNVYCYIFIPVYYF